MIIKRLIIFLLLIFAFYDTVISQENKGWLVVKSTHFIIYYKNASGDFIEKLVEESEDYYNEIAENLGFRRYNFWLWENRAKIYIYDDIKSYQASTHQPNWSSGAAIPKDKIIHTFPGEKGFFETILPHELGHIIFREFVGFDNTAIPLWLDEAVASYQEKSRRSYAKELVDAAIKEGKFISLKELFSIDPHSIQDVELVNLFYAESLTILDYLIKEFGSDNFVLFCQGLRDKRNLEAALSYAYPFKNLPELDGAWQRSLTND